MEFLNEEAMRRYVQGKKLGEGTYANVFLGHLRRDPNALVAIKKIKKDKNYLDGMKPDAIRESKYLQELHHPNIIRLHSVFYSTDMNLNLVLEFLPLGDLEMIIKDTANISYFAPEMKAWMGMLTRAVWFCHENFVLHRDIKPNNLLIAADGELKLGDFGLARSFADPAANMTSNVITRWYRPPELLFGARHYSGAVDIWSVGTVFAELISRSPMMPGASDLDQIAMICARVGKPTEDNWPGVTKFQAFTTPDVLPQPVWDRNTWTALFQNVGPEGIDLLRKTLTLDPKKRITARGMLEHRWWKTDPKPTPKEQLPKKRNDKENKEKLAEDLKRAPGELGDKKGEEKNRGAKVARRLDFGAPKGA